MLENICSLQKSASETMTGGANNFTNMQLD